MTPIIWSIGPYRICSGQRRSRTGGEWGICLDNYDLVPWWRHESSDGRRLLTYPTPEAASRAMVKLAEGPLPPRLEKALNDRRRKRAGDPRRVKAVPAAGYGLNGGHSCYGCHREYPGGRS